MLFPGGKSRALTFSYDDNTIFDRRLVEIFNRSGMRATFHVNSGRYGGERYIDATEINSLYRGHEIAAHTVSHPDLTTISSIEVTREILEDRQNLEDLAGRPVRGLSYPYGRYNAEVVRLLPGLGIEYARTIRSTGHFGLPSDFLVWDPSCHHRTSLHELGERFLRAKPAQSPVLFVWGHAFDFDKDGNWEVIEQFCEKMSGRDDIWYATNIEIVDYVAAFRGLRWSADGSMAYNPSAAEVTLSVDRKTVAVPPGETIRLAG